MNVWQAVLLGIIQGLTEFLPVSSSGHLVLGQELMGIQEPDLTFDVMVHFGTLLAVVAALWPEVRHLFQAVWEGGARLVGRRETISPTGREGLRLLGLLIVGTIPVGLVGFFFSSFVENLFTSTTVVGIMLLITGTILLIADRWPAGNTNLEKMRLSDALFVGTLQILALAPGMSRSGTTISAGLLKGLKRETAARFSFLLSIPAILGATVLEASDFMVQASGLSFGVLIIGTVSAAGSGYLAIRLLLSIIKSRSLFGFSLYTWVLGALVLALSV